MTSKSCYELLEVPTSASPIEIKQAFRRAIAKYHPDKVQHLGAELQKIAAVRAAEITWAYRTLATASSGGSHDVRVGSPAVPPHHAASNSDRVEARGLIQRAALARFRSALREEGWCGEPSVPPFDVSATSTKGWRRKGWRILGRLVGELSDATVQETWTSARRIQRTDGSGVCVFLMGGNDCSPSPPASRARASDFSGGEPSLLLLLIDVRTWHADAPNRTPSVAAALLRRLSA
jgi:hypothetical protein